MSNNPEKNILVVDDDPSITLLIEITLSMQSGLRIDTFNDPVKALEKIEKDVQTPDLVISDRDMPGMKGEVFAERLQEILGRRTPPIRVPILVLSARDMTQETEAWTRFRDAGAVANIRKPFSPAKCLAVVNSLLTQPGL